MGICLALVGRVPMSSELHFYVPLKEQKIRIQVVMDLSHDAQQLRPTDLTDL